MRTSTRPEWDYRSTACGVVCIRNPFNPRLMRLNGLLRPCGQRAERVSRPFIHVQKPNWCRRAANTDKQSLEENWMHQRLYKRHWWWPHHRIPLYGRESWNAGSIDCPVADGYFPVKNLSRRTALLINQLKRNVSGERCLKNKMHRWKWVVWR